MSEIKKDFLKIQEWVVRFDGQIKQSQQLISLRDYNESSKNKFKDKN
tara:strand:- start:457 stop:597 length:141 start_codon:yes stop_codon:yes gene_type:complete